MIFPIKMNMDWIIITINNEKAYNIAIKSWAIECEE